MLTLSLISIIACSGDKDDTAIEETDTSVTEETDTETEDTETGEEETDTENPPGNAKVRVVHASPDAPPVDIFVNGEPSGIENLSFKDGTAFVELPSGILAVAPQVMDLKMHFRSHWMQNWPLMVYTALAHGLGASMESNGFAISPFVATRRPNAGTFRNTSCACCSWKCATVDLEYYDIDNPSVDRL